MLLPRTEQFADVKMSFDAESSLIPRTLGAQRKPHEEVGTVYVCLLVWGQVLCRWVGVLYSLIPRTLGARRKPHEEVGTVYVCLLVWGHTGYAVGCTVQPHPPNTTQTT